MVGQKTMERYVTNRDVRKDESKLTQWLSNQGAPLIHSQFGRGFSTIAPVFSSIPNKNVKSSIMIEYFS